MVDTFLIDPQIINPLYSTVLSENMITIMIMIMLKHVNNTIDYNCNCN